MTDVRIGSTAAYVTSVLDRLAVLGGAFMRIDELVFKEASENLFLTCWVPETTTVVLGRSNDAEKECHTKLCDQEGVEILKRAGGGGTVVLHSGCVVVSFGAWMHQPFKNDVYFSLINQSISTAIQKKYGSLDIRERGISDLAIGDKKIAGTSLFRSKGYLLYQASILVDSRVEMIERLLKHPSKEPDYRQGKTHRDFVAGLNEYIPGLSPKELVLVFNQSLKNILLEFLGEELSEVDPNHLSWILKRGES